MTANKYIGRKCQHCGERVRYISNTHCVNCKGMSVSDRTNSNRARAIKRKIRFVMGNFEAW